MPGKGTGLGLSQIYGFVKQSGGHIKIYSEPGQGTTVKIFLPRYVGEQEEAPLARRLTDPQKALPTAKAGETIVVVDDDEQMRGGGVAMLRELERLVHQIVNARIGRTQSSLQQFHTPHHDGEGLETPRHW